MQVFTMNCRLYSEIYCSSSLGQVLGGPPQNKTHTHKKNYKQVVSVRICVLGLMLILLSFFVVFFVCFVPVSSVALLIQVVLLLQLLPRPLSSVFSCYFAQVPPLRSSAPVHTAIQLSRLPRLSIVLYACRVWFSPSLLVLILIGFAAVSDFKFLFKPSFSCVFKLLAAGSYTRMTIKMYNKCLQYIFAVKNN